MHPVPDELTGTVVTLLQQILRELQAIRGLAADQLRLQNAIDDRKIAEDEQREYRKRMKELAR